MSDWAAVVDKTTGRTYYYNKVTRQTQWSKPADFGEQPQQAPSPAQEVDPELIGSLWSELTDQKSGRKYYYNKRTKKTSWKRPECMDRPDPEGASSTPATAVASPAATTAPVQPVEQVKPQQAQPEPTPVAVTQPTPSPVTQPPAATPAPAATPSSAASDWAETVDPKSGRKYWYHKVTKKTSWKRPSVLAAQDATTPSPVAQQQPQQPATTQPTPVAQTQPAAAVPAKSRLASALADTSDDEPTHKAGASSGQDLFDDPHADEDGNKALELESDSDDGTEMKFAKHRKGFISRVLRTKGSILDDQKVLTWKRTCIKKSLLKQNRQLDAEAIQAFRNVMSYMGDRSSSKGPIDHAKKMIRNLMIAPAGLRDEVYLQIAKQTNKNPRVERAAKGWELMTFCLATFPPSKSVRNYLTQYIDNTIADSADARIVSLAKACVPQIDRIVQMGQRKQIPSVRELDALRETRKVPLDIPLLNGEIRTVEVDSYTTVRQVEQLITGQMHLVFTEPFGLYEVGAANVERLLDPTERILDVIASWENEPLDAEDNRTGSKGAKQYKSIYSQLLYKAKLVLKMTVPEIANDVEAINLLYIQAVHDIITDRYPVRDKDIVVLAALQLQAQHGDYKPNVHTQGWLAESGTLTQYIPQALIPTDKKGNPDVRISNEWEEKIMSKYKKFNGFTALDSKTNYLQLVQEWHFYGATFFQVEQRQFKDYPAVLLIAITCEAILLIHPVKRTILENYPYPDIVTWGHSDEKFIIVVGNIVQQRKLIFKADDGKVMNLLVHEYVRFKVRSKASQTAISD